MTGPWPRFRWPAGDASAEDILSWGFEEFGPGLAICTSFQATGSVIVHMAARLIGSRAKVFTVDTGRFHEETYKLISDFRSRYGITVQLVVPDAVELGAMVTKYGPNLFYEDLARRKLCCEVRKVRPLKRKLASLDAWVTGLRHDQNGSRRQVARIDVDELHGGILKLAPLADWTSERVFDYARRNDVPLHPLYSRGYTSIGCRPCTREIRPGEDSRAGRWWWEDSGEKECGMHVTGDGSLRREFDILLDGILPARRPFLA